MRRLPILTLLAFLAIPSSSWAQAVVVDQGTFAIEVNGVSVGTEQFKIRRSGILSNATFIADAEITLRQNGEESRLEPILRAHAPVGATGGYQLKVTGAESMDVQLTAAGPRFLSSFESDAGREEREFRARPDTRVVEALVAHHYYFLREVSEGDAVPVICPRRRQESRFVVAAVLEENLTLGSVTVPTRRVTFVAEGEDRIVWFDRQGRVLRVEVPVEGYVAVRRDLVG